MATARHRRCPIAMQLRSLALAISLTLPLAAAAHANPAPDVARMAADDCARARAQQRTCVLTIEDETVEGSAPRAGETEITAIGFIAASSLIRLRHHFLPELLRSAEDL